MPHRFLLAAVFAGATATAALADAPAAEGRSFLQYLEQVRTLVKQDQGDINLRLRLAGMLETAGMRDESIRVLQDLEAQFPNFREIVSPANGLPYSEHSAGCDGTGLRATGPDVIVGDLPSIGNFTSGGPVNNTLAFSLATTSCNPGTALLNWIQNTNDHPVIMQNFYRIKGGRIEQIGASWLKHGFCALQNSVCGTCQPAGGGCVSALGLGCSDPYSAGLNGTQTNLGPRSQVNSSTGVFPYPYSPQFPGGTALDRRIRVPVADMDPALNAGATYLAEGMYVAKDDARAGNGFNNASYRGFSFSWAAGNVSSIFMTGSTVRQKAAIEGWKDLDATVNLVNVFTANEGFYETSPPNTSVATGKMIVGWKITDNGNGTWRYEYAVFNQNSDRAGASFSVPVPNGVTLTNVSFRDIPLVGEPYDTTDWVFSSSGGRATWTCPQTFAQNANANALRWGMLYNFAFTANVGPASYANGGRIDAFKPSTPAGGPGSYSFTIDSVACRLAGDYNGDQVVDFGDLNIVLGAFGNPYTFNELNIVLGNFGLRCF